MHDHPHRNVYQIYARLWLPGTWIVETCDHYECPDGYKYVDDYKYIQCEDDKCSKDECCEKKGECS